MDIDFFEDGSSIEWYSKESLMYRKDGFSVQVVFSCYNGRWFKMGRIIMSDHLLLWEDYPNGCSNKIGKDEKYEIIKKAITYFSKRGIQSNIN